MPKSNFVNGTVVSPDYLNALQDIQFDGQDLDGHYPKIVDTYLSDASNSLKTRTNSFLNSLLVSPGTGLSVNYQGGSVRLADGSIASVAPNAVVIANNATSCIFVNQNGAVQADSDFPSRCLRLASVTAVSGAVNSVTDVRPRFQIQPIWNLVKFLGGSGDQGDLVVSGSLTLSLGEYYYRSIRVNAGATLTIDKSAFLHIERDFFIEGTIIITPAAPGGSGGTGALQIVGTMLSSGSGIGGIFGQPQTYNHFLSSLGSGGAAGIAIASSISTGGYISGGGAGGGALLIECGGSFTLGGNGAIIARGGNAQPGTIISYGGGVALISGAGGGSGGLILIKAGKAINAAPTTVIDTRGGNGSNAVSIPGGTNAGYGGGEGGGGRVICQAPLVNLSGSILLSPGQKGVNYGVATVTDGLGSGSGGSFGGKGGVYNGNGEFPGTSGVLVANQIFPVG